MLQNFNYLMEMLQEKQIGTVTRKKHTYVMYQGIESEYIYILKEGVAKISNILQDGREFNIAYMTEPDFVYLLEKKQTNNVFALFNVRVETKETPFYKVPRKAFGGIGQH